MSRAGLASPDVKAGGRIANVEQAKAALGRNRYKPGLVTQSLMEAGSDIHSCDKRGSRVIDYVRAERPAAIGNAKHQCFRTCSRCICDRQAPQTQSERAPVVTKFANAIFPPESCEATRGLDVHGIVAVADIQEEGARDHGITLSPLAPLRA